MKILFASLAILAVLVIAAWKSSRFGYESAGYEVIEKDGAFEIRDYQALVIASTPMDVADPNDGGTFMRLFKYISKNNEAEEKIAMTTPVFMNQQGNHGEMSFVVPASVAEAGAPEPKSNQVEIKKWEPGKVAVYRYRGSWGPKEKQAAREKLDQWIASRKLQPRGEGFSAGYDPPFTPGIFRRNEVLVPIQ